MKTALVSGLAGMVLLLCCTAGSRGEESLIVVPGRIPYMDESVGHVVVTTIHDQPGSNLTLEVSTAAGDVLGTGPVAPGQRSIVQIPLAGLSEGTNQLHCRLLASGTEGSATDVTLTRLPPKPHAVQIDNRRRGLLVNGLPFFPFGFFNGDGDMDSPVDLAEQGFNLYAPYSGGWHGTPALIAKIRAWMDRCAAVGVKVNYDLRYDYYFRDLVHDGTRIFGGEWVDQMTPELEKVLRMEVEAFRDHPALLSWYIADEPKESDSSRLEAMRRCVKELDPYHPVTIVFHEGQHPGKAWHKITDVTWMDPYPVNILARDQRSNPYWQAVPPDVRRGVASWTAWRLAGRDRLFAYSSPLWHSPQFFGGGWGSQKREPSAQELRAMTYAGLITGATAIQYFIYSPGIFPTSPRLTAEAGKLAQEVMEMTPFLLSEEPRRIATASGADVLAGAWQDRGTALVTVVNVANAPSTFRVTLEDCSYSGPAEVLFENREVEVHAGVIDDIIDAQGTRVYQIPEGPFQADRAPLAADNLRDNASFEAWVSAASPPDVMANRSRGSTCFLDGRTAVNGRHSLRITAADTKGVELTFNAVGQSGVFTGAKIQPADRYRVSIWAKADRPGIGLLLKMSNTDRADGEQFTLGTEWQEHSVVVTVKDDPENVIGPALDVSGPGTAWLDLLQIVPAE